MFEIFKAMDRLEKVSGGEQYVELWIRTNRNHTYGTVIWWNKGPETNLPEWCEDVETIILDLLHQEIDKYDVL